jgi:flagellar basal-body rod modification protein FlgD
MPVSGATSNNASDYYIQGNSVTEQTAIKGKSADQMDMDDFFSLLIAQMTNQDMMEPTDNTEFVSQMASFTSLSGLQKIQEYQLSSYATSYAGKYVTISETNASGDLNTITGQVDSVTFYGGSPMVVVGGKQYDLYKVMEVSSQPFPTDADGNPISSTPAEETQTDGTDTETDTE